MDYTYSYSGADCDAYAYFDHDPKRKVYKLNSLATISISVHEAKSPVRRLGDRGISGITSSIRTIAGSMIMLTIEDHPLGEMLADQYKYVQSWSRDQGRSKSGLSFRNLSTMLPEFNIMLVYKTEITKNKKRRSFNYIGGEENTSVLIKNVSLVNEGMVTSINDLVTEVSLQFICKDVQMIENTHKSKEYWMRNNISQKSKSNQNKTPELSEAAVEQGSITLKQASEETKKLQSEDKKLSINEKLSSIDEERKKAAKEKEEVLDTITSTVANAPKNGGSFFPEFNVGSITEKAKFAIKTYERSLKEQDNIHGFRKSYNGDITRSEIELLMQLTGGSKK